jgi:CHAD domain-containing protein
MHKDLRRLTREIRQAARDLRHGYEPSRLYDFRVAIRRVRSILKHRGSKRARRLRRTWGGFAAATNRARDWDVFLSTADQLLVPAELEEFRRVTEAPLLSSHGAVTRMLKSARWHAHLKEWRRFLKRARKHGEKQGDQTAVAQPAEALDAALARARDTLATALQLDNDIAWHRFRIAVKEVRYSAELEPHPAGEPGAARIAESCKALQSLLGGWHDCVVQLQLLDQLGPSALADALRATIAEHRRRRLEEIRASVAGNSLFHLSSNKVAG